MQEFDHNRNYLYRCFRWLTNEIVKNQLQGKTNVEDVLDKFYDTVSNHISDFYVMTEEEMLDLGFIQYEGSHVVVWLIPLWLMPLIPENMKMYKPDGTSFYYNSKTAPKDIMFNCLTYGFKIKETLTYAID